jgi:hypothetical protein
LDISVVGHFRGRTFLWSDISVVGHFRGRTFPWSERGMAYGVPVAHATVSGRPAYVICVMACLFVASLI